MGDVASDIQGSTQAIKAGRYKQVNALGAASIIALLNAVHPLRIPYVFGGDGSTLCIPSTKREAVLAALLATRKMAEKSFGLGLRIGMVPMRDIVEAGFHVSVARYQPSEQLYQAGKIVYGLHVSDASLVTCLVRDNNSDHVHFLDGSNGGYALAAIALKEQLKRCCPPSDIVTD